MATANWNSCKDTLRIQLLHCRVAPVGVAASYPECTLTATLTCSSHSDIVLYETYVASQRNLDVYAVPSIRDNSSSGAGQSKF